MSKDFDPKNNLWIGLVILAVGLYFLLRNFGWLPYHIRWDYIWPVAIIGVGFWFIFSKKDDKY